MKNPFKEFVFLFCSFLGVAGFFERRNRDKIAVLMYHGVVKTELKPFCWTQISEKKFERQLTYLKKHYCILKLSEVLHRIQNGLSLPPHAAVVTFDDGYKNNYTIAYPLLKRLKIPATIFLVTRCISEQTLCWPDVLYLGIKETREAGIDLRRYGLKFYRLRTGKERETAGREIVEYLKTVSCDKKEVMLNEILKILKVEASRRNSPFDLLRWEDIKKMDDEGLVEFGAHTTTHNILSRMDDDEAEREMVESGKAIERCLGKKSLLFAYPNGRREDFNPRTKGILKDNGFACGLTTIPGLNRPGDDLFELKRVAVGADMSRARFKCLVSGFLFHLKDRSQSSG